MISYKKFLLPCFIAVLLMSSVFPLSAKGSNDEAAEKIVVVSILPQSYFVKRISGGHVRPSVLVGPGQNPHSYEPSPKQMTDMSKASAWILSNMEFEIALVPKIKSLYPKLNIVDGTQGVAFRLMTEEHDHDADESPREHSSLEIDRHTWLGREPAKILALHVYNTLADIDPPNAALYKNNYDALVKDIDAEFDSLKKELAPFRGKPVFVYHPSFGYFFDEFGIIQEAVETGGKEPSPRQMTALIEKARAEHIKVLFVQAEFPVESANTIAKSLGAQVVPLDALAEDWLANIQLMGDSLMKGIEK